MIDDMITRRTLTLKDHQMLSYLHAGEGPAIILLHGTYWSRIWQPIIPRLAQHYTVFALDYPGFGHSEGRLDMEAATVPALAALVLRAADALGIEDTFALAGHDIGGAVAQHVTVYGQGRVTKLALVNSVLYDSWPGPGVTRFRDLYLPQGITSDELVKLRRSALRKAIARDLSAAEEEDYLSPWRTDNGAYSWTALATKADPRYTLELVKPLRTLGVPTLLLWGEEDESQPIRYARRFAREIPQAHLFAVPGARHIPMEDAPELVGATLARFFTENTDV